MRKNGDLEGRILLSYPHTYNGQYVRKNSIKWVKSDVHERERERERQTEREREKGERHMVNALIVFIVLCVSRWLGCVLVSHGLDVAFHCSIFYMHFSLYRALHFCSE